MRGPVLTIDVFILPGSNKGLRKLCILRRAASRPFPRICSHDYEHRRASSVSPLNRTCVAWCYPPPRAPLRLTPVTVTLHRELPPDTAIVKRACCFYVMYHSLCIVFMKIETQSQENIRSESDVLQQQISLNIVIVIVGTFEVVLLLFN